jgi:SWI/SNF-related matrix-associated actin-dependent regulator 1 of chromatin subfamily A
MSQTPEEIEQQIKLFQEKISELIKRKEELSKPLICTFISVSFGRAANIVEFSLSREPDGEFLNRLRFIPSRRFISTRNVNQIRIEDYDRLIYELSEANVERIIPEDVQKKIDEWKAAPNFILTYNEKRNQIFINPTIRNTSLPWSNYDISTWTNHSLDNTYSFTLNELLKWMEQQVTRFKEYRFELSPEVQQLYQEQLDRDKLLDQFADMRDAPEIDFEFKYTNSSGEEVTYNLKPDQRVACKFDDTFNHRALISFDMGKGKTAIAIAQAERHNERVLFVCKADLKTNIKREIYKFTGKQAHVFAGIEPDDLAVTYMLLKKAQYNIINYDVIGRSVKDNPKDPASPELMKWVELINLSKFDRIIYDEAHYMKNMEAQRSKGGRALAQTAPKVMLLTGTPIVNRPGELFPILNIIDQNTFSDYPTFLKQFSDGMGGAKNVKQLHALLKRYMIRRLRDKTFDPNRIPQYTELSSVARKLYQEVLAGLYTALRKPNYQRDVNNILTELLRLKQICADDKVDFTVDLVETALDETEAFPWNKVLVFSQFKDTQSYIQTRLGPKARVINGDVTDKARYDLVDQFQDVKSPLKVIITNIVEGLTLTQAGTVIINDLWWTPKDHAQAEGRAYGRENDPHGGNSYFVLADDTIDSMIWEILERKTKVAKQVIDDVYYKDEKDESVFHELINLLKKGM